jgi:hypothetical protein
MFYHPALARFLDNIDNPNFNVPEKNVLSSTDFINTSSGMCHLEKGLTKDFLPHLDGAIGKTFIASAITDRTEPNGIMLTCNSHGLLLNSASEKIGIMLRQQGAMPPVRQYFCRSAFGFKKRYGRKSGFIL